MKITWVQSQMARLLVLSEVAKRVATARRNSGMTAVTGMCGMTD